MLPLCGETAVPGFDGPLIGHRTNVAPADVDHRLDRKDHAGFQFGSGARATIMKHLRVFMKDRADAMAAVFTHDAIALCFSVLLDRVTDIAQMCAWSDLRDAKPHAFEGSLHELLNENRTCTNDEHPAGIAEITVFDHGNIDVERVAVLDHLGARNAVTDYVIDRNAGGFRVRRVTRRLIVERRGHGALLLQHVFVAQAIEFAGRDSSFYKGLNIIKHFAGKPAGGAHVRDIVFGFKRYCHGL